MTLSYQGRALTVLRPAIPTDSGYTAGSVQDFVQFADDNTNRVVLRSEISDTAARTASPNQPGPRPTPTIDSLAQRKGPLVEAPLPETITILKPGPVPNIVSSQVTSPDSGQITMILKASDGREFTATGGANFFSWHDDVAKIMQTLANTILASCQPKAYVPPHPGNSQ